MSNQHPPGVADALKARRAPKAAQEATQEDLPRQGAHRVGLAEYTAQKRQEAAQYDGEPKSKYTPTDLEMFPDSRRLGGGIK